METIGQALRNIGPGRIAIVGGVLLALIVFFIIFAARFTNTNMEPLYSGLNTNDSTRIVAQLQTMGAKYEVQKGGKEILVSASDVTRVRLQLAEQHDSNLRPVCSSSG